MDNSTGDYILENLSICLSQLVIVISIYIICSGYFVVFFYIFNNKKAIFFLINELKMKKLYTAEMQPLFHPAFIFTGLKVSRLLL